MSQLFPPAPEVESQPESPGGPRKVDVRPSSSASARGGPPSPGTLETPRPSSQQSEKESSNGGRRNSGFNLQLQRQGGVLRKKSNKRDPPKCLKLLGAFMDGPYMSLVSVSLTLWALLGDDIRLLATDKPADSAFNIITLVCLTFFAIEIILASLCKQDYIFGFFFILDCVSTASLVLDLTWVIDNLSSTDLESDQAGGLQTAQVGAFGRIVRVLRLIRIVKIYKAFSEKFFAELKKNTVQAGEEEDEWDRDDALKRDPGDDKPRESAVGKKLVMSTTRRVIILVLTMLLIYPMLTVSSFHDHITSGAFGVDDVFETYLETKVAGSSTGTGSTLSYEQSLLRYLYYHNWFLYNNKCDGNEESSCSQYQSHIFWLGFAGKEKTYPELEPLTTLARPNSSVVATWNAEASTANTVYQLGSYPQQAQDSLSNSWDIDCLYGGWKHLGASLLKEKISGTVDYVVRCPDDLRHTEHFAMRPKQISQSQFEDYHIVFFYDARPYVKADAGNNMLLTGFICLVLTLATMLFTKDANQLVLRPVDSMIEKVNVIRDNPLAAMKLADDEFKSEQIRKHRAAKKGFYEVWLDRFHLGFLARAAEWTYALTCGSDQEDTAMMETAVLEKTIIKLGSLLALGFGEAGASIVADNMQGLDSAGVNAMVPGSKIECIIGSARICDFSTATEVLQGKVMTFVNQIAEIVHGLVNEFHGAPNKNSGDRFLLIWRLGTLLPEQQMRLADMAMISFIRILGCCHNSKVLAEYREHPGLMQRLGSSCRVNLTFGLHSGWAIEGAVGSEFKIDASYLSPNVSIAESIEDATRIYNVSLIASETVVGCCSKRMASMCRLIDKVHMKGSKDPFTLFTFDLDWMSVRVKDFPTKLEWSVRQRFKARQIMELEKEKKWADDLDAIQTFILDSKDVNAMRKPYTEEFLQLFNMGYQNYSQGEWEVARRLLEETQAKFGFDDGPSGALLAFMAAENRGVKSVGILEAGA